MDIRFSSKSFGARQVLKPISLSLADRKVTALLGPSGIGKTTLLRLIAGLETDDSGRTAAQAAVGFVFQEPRLMPWLTAWQNTDLAAPTRDWLSRVGLEGFENHYPRQLSLGMARRVALARALACGPELLILDEPFASLDEATASDMKALLSGMFSATPVTAILVSHQPEDAAQLADAVIMLEGSPAGVGLALPISVPRGRRSADDIAGIVQEIRAKTQ
jgi:ABC-type nitrate/sulfonate/bicarbonate transport system ATPase subunit